MNYIVIMAGGSGTRLWPLSRQTRPKHLQKLLGEKSLLQLTYKRVLKATFQRQIYVSTLKAQVGEIKKQIPIEDDHLFLEPALRNTAPAIGLAAVTLFRKDPEAIIATTPSDQAVQDTEEYGRVIRAGFAAVEKYPDHLLTVGLKPTRAETGYGYIKISNLKSQISKQKIYEVEKFVEKPNLKTAKKYLKSGGYLWNASYFIFKAETLLDWYKKYTSKTYQILEKIDSQNIDQLYPRVENEPIDTAIVEKLKKVLSIPAELGWSDVGSWDAVHEILEHLHGSHLVAMGEADHLDIGSEKVLIHGQKKLIATAGLKNIAIIDTPDALLVIEKTRAQDVKKIVEKLKEIKKEKYL